MCSMCVHDGWEDSAVFMYFVPGVRSCTTRWGLGVCLARHFILSQGIPVCVFLLLFLNWAFFPFVSFILPRIHHFPLWSSVLFYSNLLTFRVHCIYLLYHVSHYCTSTLYTSRDPSYALPSLTSHITYLISYHLSIHLPVQSLPHTLPVSRHLPLFPPPASLLKRKKKSFLPSHSTPTSCGPGEPRSPALRWVMRGWTLLEFLSVPV